MLSKGQVPRLLELLDLGKRVIAHSQVRHIGSLETPNAALSDRLRHLGRW